MNEKSGNKLVNIIPVVATTLVLAAVLLLIFVDSFSNQLGALVLKANFSDFPNEYAIGKIVAYGLLPFTPALLMYVLALIFGNEGKGAFVAVPTVGSIGLIVLFFFKAKEFFPMLERDNMWFYDLGRIYIWYALPFISMGGVYLFFWLDTKMCEHPVGYSLVCAILVPFFVVALPALVGLIGILITLAIIVFFAIFLIRIFANVAENSVDTTEAEYVLDDGTKLKHVYDNRYKDERGGMWTSYDGGKTFYED